MKYAYCQLDKGCIFGELYDVFMSGEYISLGGGVSVVCCSSHGV